ncbi:MAG TPA: homogentisate 1,2-dioxygenase, partial [Acidimicrobiales bacterium]
MPFYRSVGEVPRKRHTVATSDEGRRSEELMGQEGFSEEASLLYHRHSPSALTAIETVDEPHATALAVDLPLTPRHIRTGGLPAGGDVVLGRQVVLGNQDVVLGWAVATEDSDLYRNAIGDELVYVHDGEATLETSFGALGVASGDYVVVPRGTTHRWVLGGDRLEVLVFEVAGHVRFPERYLSSRGQLKEGAPFSERDLRGPDEPLLVEGADVAVLVRNRAGLSRLVHARHPFDVVGWDGCLYPHALS